MLSAVMKYSAVSAKMRALYGKMLSDDDWKRVCGMRSTGELAAFLKVHPGWSDAARLLPAGEPKINDFEDALGVQILSEFERVYSFASLQDKRYLIFMTYKAEERLILEAYNRLAAVRETISPPRVPEALMQRSRLDFAALKNADKYADIVEAASATIYYGSLKAALKGSETGLPEYGKVSISLENKYYSAVFHYVDKDFTGIGRQKLLESLGTQADLLNIIHILRIKRYFPASLESAVELLIPVKYRLNDKMIKEIVSAPTENMAVATLSATSLGKYFKDFDYSNLERQYESAMSSFLHKLFRTPQPSLCIVQAYLSLKRIESEKLLRVAEAIHYGVDPALTL